MAWSGVGKETRRRGEEEKRRRGEEELLEFPSSPCLLVSLSPCLLALSRGGAGPSEDRSTE
jgi:hypothetical protein